MNIYYRYYIICALICASLHVIGKTATVIGLLYYYDVDNATIEFSNSGAWTLLVLFVLFLICVLLDAQRSRHKIVYYASLVFMSLDFFGRCFNFKIVTMLFYDIIFFLIILYHISPCQIVKKKIMSVKECIDAFREINKNGIYLLGLYSRRIHGFVSVLNKLLYWNCLVTYVTFYVYYSNMNDMLEYGNQYFIEYFRLSLIMSLIIVALYQIPSLVFVLLGKNIYIRVGVMEYNKNLVQILSYHTDASTLKNEIVFLERYKRTKPIIKALENFIVND